MLSYTPKTHPLRCNSRTPWCKAFEKGDTAALQLTKCRSLPDKCNYSHPTVACEIQPAFRCVVSGNFCDFEARKIVQNEEISAARLAFARRPRRLMDKSKCYMPTRQWFMINLSEKIVDTSYVACAEWVGTFIQQPIQRDSPPEMHPYLHLSAPMNNAW